MKIVNPQFAKIKRKSRSIPASLAIVGASWIFLLLFASSVYVNVEVCVACAGLALVALMFAMVRAHRTSSNAVRPESPVGSQPPSRASRAGLFAVPPVILVAGYFYFYSIVLSVCCLFVMFSPHAIESKKYDVLYMSHCRKSCGNCEYRLEVEWQWGTLASPHLCASEEFYQSARVGETVVVDGKFYEYAAYVVDLRRPDR